MPRSVFPTVFAAILTTSCAASTIPAAQSASGESCRITTADKARNAALSYVAFDQSGSLPSTARALADRGCHAAAAEAGEDYLARATFNSERARTSVIFHMAQSLAMAGKVDTAAAVVVGARRTDQVLSTGFDWNSYVTGTWAFLRRNRAVLAENHARLAASITVPDRTNARVLGGLLACFDQPYLAAYTPRCNALGTPPASVR